MPRYAYTCAVHLTGEVEADDDEDARVRAEADAEDQVGEALRVYTDFEVVQMPDDTPDDRQGDETDGR